MNAKLQVKFVVGLQMAYGNVTFRHVSRINGDVTNLFSFGSNTHADVIMKTTENHQFFEY